MVGAAVGVTSIIVLTLESHRFALTFPCRLLKREGNRVPLCFIYYYYLNACNVR